MQLKKCPFCGSVHLSMEIKASAWNNKDMEEHIVCNDCASSSPTYIWNQRFVEPETTKPIS